MTRENISARNFIPVIYVHKEQKIMKGIFADLIMGIIILTMRIIFVLFHKLFQQNQ